jgi:hypothetical protein
MTQPKRVPVNVGDELHLRDEDYRYGVGPLRLRVLAVGKAQQLQDRPWIIVRGTVLGRGNRELGEREALVRLATDGLWLRKQPNEP